MRDADARPPVGSSARAQLLTVLGEFVLPHGGAVWTSTLVRALGTLGVDERNARQAIARLGRRGLLAADKRGRVVRWHLTDAGHRLLTEGTKRIYEFGDGGDAWDGRWLVVLCSVPEEHRAKRHRLRRQLEFAGFGFVAPGVAVSPHVDREGIADAVLRDLDQLAGAMVFRAEPGELLAVEELLRRGWDLGSLATRYAGFVDGVRAWSPRDDGARFAALTWLVDEWRRFPSVDPEIPLRLLPARWPGRRAKELFDDRHARWAPGANRWYLAAEADADGE